MQHSKLQEAANALQQNTALTHEAFQQAVAEYLLDAHPTHGNNPKTYYQIIKETKHIPHMPHTPGGLSHLANTLGIPPRTRGRWKGQPSALHERNAAIANEVRQCELTLQQIANKHGLTRERVRQIAKEHGITRTQLREQDQ